MDYGASGDCGAWEADGIEDGERWFYFGCMVVHIHSKPSACVYSSDTPLLSLCFSSLLKHDLPYIQPTSYPVSEKILS